MSEKIINQLMKVAGSNPDLTKHVSRIAEFLGHHYRQASFFDKVAINKTTETLIQWASLRDERVSEKEVEDFFKRQYGWDPRDANSNAPSDPAKLRWRKGYRVGIDVTKCKNEKVLPIIEEFHGMVGIVEQTEVEDPDLMPEIPVKKNKSAPRNYGSIIIKLDNGPTLLIPEGQKQSTGLITPIKTGGAVLEVVYSPIPDRIPTERAKQEAQAYLEGQKPGEARSLNYFSGPVQSLVRDSKNDLLIYIFAQQRGRTSSFNVTTGNLLYMGIQQRRPKGMIQDIEKFIATGRWPH